MGDIKDGPVLAGIAAEEFKGKADGRVDEEVDGEEEAVCFVAGVEEAEEEPEKNEGAGFKELDGIEGDSGEKGTGVAGGGIGDAEAGGGGGAAVAAAIHEAADAANGVADGEAGDGVVGNGEDGLAVAAGEEDEGEGGEDEAAVEDEAALIDADDFEGVGGEVGGIGHDEGDAGADDAGEHKPDAEVGGIFGISGRFAAKPAPGEDGADEAEGGAEAIGMDGFGADMKEYGMHVFISFCRSEGRECSGSGRKYQFCLRGNRVFFLSDMRNNDKLEF